jgi:ATP-dependent DNA helicase RecQ
MSRIKDIKKKGYVAKLGKINYIVYWQRENLQDEIKIILPEIYFKNVDRSITSKYY